MTVFKPRDCLSKMGNKVRRALVLVMGAIKLKSAKNTTKILKTRHLWQTLKVLTLRGGKQSTSSK